MSSQAVLQVLDMGFDYEQVRTVVHLNMVQAGHSHYSSMCVSCACVCLSVCLSVTV